MFLADGLNVNHRSVSILENGEATVTSLTHPHSFLYVGIWLKGLPRYRSNMGSRISTDTDIFRTESQSSQMTRSSSKGAGPKISVLGGV